MRTLIRTSLLALLVLPLSAQQAGWGIQGGLIHGLESLKKATNASQGFHLGADYTTRLPHADMGVRAGAAFVAMPGSARHGLKTSLNLMQVFGDLWIPAGSPDLHVLAGLSLNHYSMSKSGSESLEPTAVDRHFPVRDVKGLKFGVRLGVSYRFSERFSGEALLQQTELAGKDLSDPRVRAGGINPAWIQLGVRYSF